MTAENFEEIIVEYWPNQSLDPIGRSPHITKLEVKLSQFEEGDVWTNDRNVNEGVEEEEPATKNSKRTSILVIFFVFLLFVGICLLCSKKLKSKFRDTFRVNAKTDLSDQFKEPNEIEEGQENNNDDNEQQQPKEIDDNKLFEKEDLE